MAKGKLSTMRMEDIRPYPNNPRRNDGAVDAVAESIRQCGYVAPIIVDEDGVILAGHTRYKALQKLGYETADVLVKSGMTEEQKKKYRLLDNKTSELAQWDFELLANELDGMDFGALELDWGLAIEESEPRERQEAAFHESISVVIDCHDDDEAEKIFSHLVEEGYNCRISTL